LTTLPPLHFREGEPEGVGSLPADLHDLPWHLPVADWPTVETRLEQVPHGLHRHPVVFVNQGGVLYAIKELPPGMAAREHALLEEIHRLGLPGVQSVGYISTHTAHGEASVLVTRYLDGSLPYRSLFLTSGLLRYRESLLDSIAGLLVQIHVAGVYWGDCSLSNLLFRRDDGALQAYLVDAETAEFHPGRLPPDQRFYDLEIMEENIDGELNELLTAGMLAEGIPVSETGVYIRQSYRRLWDEIAHDVVFHPNERYRIQERIRALNDMGFSVGGILLDETSGVDQVRLRVQVTDRNYHRRQLEGLIGITAEENQARKIMNEIQEQKASLSREHNRSTPLGAAAYHWLEELYKPTLQLLQSVDASQMTPPELYCQVLEHKWFLSERAGHDVGHVAAAEDYLHHILESPSKPQISG
jgi:Domain of unknown function (DUF4032)/Lipopolysaccharide kinase (Kdo/WaaP) family